MERALPDTLRRLLIDASDGEPKARIVRALSGHGAVSAHQIARATGLARSTVSTGLADLRRSGLLVEAGEDARGMGRPTQLHLLRPSAGLCAGVLIGLDDIRVCLANVGHEVLGDETVPLPRDYTPDEALEALASTLRSLALAQGSRTEDLLGVGLAVSAPVTQAGVVRGGSILPTWAGLDLAAWAAPALGCPIHAENESHCAALAEMIWGAAIGEDNFVLFKLDMGVGGAVVLDGRVRSGVSGGAAEFGHMVLDPSGRVCRCGNRGCLETLIGGGHALALAADLPSVPSSLPDLALLAANGDDALRRLIVDLADIAGWGLSIIAAILNPPLVVVTGALAATGSLLIDPLKASYERHALFRTGRLPDAERTRFLSGRFLTNDTVMGAAALVLRQHGRVA